MRKITIVWTCEQCGTEVTETSLDRPENWVQSRYVLGPIHDFCSIDCMTDYIIKHYVNTDLENHRANDW